MSEALSNRLRVIAICWIAVAGAAFCFILYRHTQVGLTDGTGRPFGDDFINYWSGAYLAWHGRVGDIYDWNLFHAFEAATVGADLDFYHYSYPPVLLLLTAPLAFVPYVPALFLWTIAGWLCFYAALNAARPGRATLLLALATPAVFVNAIGGQNGTWTAALLGGGLTLLERRPVAAGVLLGLLIYKPQLGILLPVALIAGRHFRAITAAAVTVAALVLASIVVFGVEPWTAYSHNLPVLRHLILEEGVGVWHRMLSVFVFARRLGFDVPASYAVQAIAALVVAIVVALAWWRDVAAAARNALLVLGTMLATPYLQDYDLVIGAIVVAWLAGISKGGQIPRPLLIAAGLILIAPFVAALLAKLTGLEYGPLFIAPAFVIAARAAPGKAPPRAVVV